ncbi:MAG TPA: hypothetical protein VFC53_03045 [Dehalococcoidia bacterium]|nr:hypothetical protein [Dehalococcoidia bacterium]
MTISRARLASAALALAVLVMAVAGIAALFVPPIAVAALALAAAGLAGASTLARRDASDAPARLLEKVSEQAQSGRRLVIYERETGLFAHWYIALRGEEECDRAARYKRPMSLMLVEPGSRDAGWEARSKLADWLSRNLRATDVAGYLGNGRFIAILPETEQGSTPVVIERLRSEIESVETSVAAFGKDGVSYEDLYRAAANGLRASVAA